MSAPPVHHKGDGVRHGAKGSRMITDGSGRHGVVIVQGQRKIRTREARKEAVLQHRGSTAGAAFFRRLSYKHQRAVPTVFVLRHPAGGAGPSGHVNIMTASMHHGSRLTSSGLPDDGTRKRQPSLLFHW